MECYLKTGKTGNLALNLPKSVKTWNISIFKSFYDSKRFGRNFKRLQMLTNITA